MLIFAQVCNRPGEEVMQVVCIINCRGLMLLLMVCVALRTPRAHSSIQSSVIIVLLKEKG